VSPTGKDVVSGVPNRYVESMARMNGVQAIGAVAIHVLTLVQAWGHWRVVTIMVAGIVLVTVWNSLVTLVLLKRVPLIVGELVRTLVNVGFSIYVAHYLDWPLPVWLWLPYVAIAFDYLDERVAVGATVTMCLGIDTFALIDGIDWMYPACFTMLAVLCLSFSKVRFDVMRRMLFSSDRHRNELEKAHAELRHVHQQLEREMLARAKAEVELRQAQKLEAVGRLAAGIAHEINTPVQFVGDNVHFIRDAIEALFPLIETYRAALRSLDGRVATATATEVALSEDAADLAYLEEHVPAAAMAALGGLDRIAAIVRSMKQFAHPDQKEMAPVDINQGISSTLTIAKSEYKHVAEVETHLGELPLVTCFGGDVNQVLLNILINAAHAIGDVVSGTERKGRIVVTTERRGENVRIAIADDGPGIPVEIRERIFEPFFTTKEVGKGTGQGLAIARAVVERHHGTIRFETEVGEGTTFFVTLPIHGRRAPAEAA
jgi:signal transduction histidine kinase